MVWQPPDLSASCVGHSNLDACSSFGFFYLSFLVQLFGGSEDERIQEKLRKEEEESRIIDACYGEELEESEKEIEEFDFIVVGAGAAGCVVANRLTEIKNWTVLLLEAGPEQPDVTLPPAMNTVLLGSSIDWGYKTQPEPAACWAQPGSQCAWPRGKVMGGSTSINGMAYVRGNKADYDNWARMGNPGWSYDEVLPYFKKSEKNLQIASLGLNPKYHGTSGPQPVSQYPYIDKPSQLLTEAFDELGIPKRDFNSREQEGTMQAQDFQEGGVRVSANKAFIQPIRYKRKNLTVRPESEVKRILIDKNKIAYGVVYTKDGTEYKAYAKKEVIVSGGTINSPKLLMQSGIGPKEHLQDLGIPVIKDSPVGKNLQDHPTFNGDIISFPNDIATNVSHYEIVYEVLKYYFQKQKSGNLTEDGQSSTISFLKTDPNLEAPDIQYQMVFANIKDFVEDPVGAANMLIFPTAFFNAVATRTQNLVPKSRGEILLNASDINGPPLIYANYLSDSSDVDLLIKGVKILYSLEDTNVFKKYGIYFDKTPLPACKQYKLRSDKYIECLARSYTGSTYHPIGTCKMGPDDGTSVVDPKLKVYGVKNLRVIDASIMPDLPRCNLNAPSLMVGEKGADLVKEDNLR